MGSVNLESYNAVIDDINLLNNEPEIKRLGLVFESYGTTCVADAKGNVSTYYVIIEELLKHLISGHFIGSVIKSTGKEMKLSISSTLVTENNKNITKLFKKPTGV